MVIHARGRDSKEMRPGEQLAGTLAGKIKRRCIALIGPRAHP